MPSTLRLLKNAIILFEDVIGLWIQQQQQENSNRGEGRECDSSSLQGNGGGKTMTQQLSDQSAPVAGDKLTYSGLLHLARLMLRLWLKMAVQLLHSSLQDQHLSEVQPLLVSPLEIISKACSNLQQVGTFKGHSAALDHEFTIIILEGLFSALHVVNLLPSVPICQVNNFYEALRDSLTDNCLEWFAYLCSKLHGISKYNSANTSEMIIRQDQGGKINHGDEEVVKDSSPEPVGSNWALVLGYSYSLLTNILAELLSTSAIIKSSQQALKLALAGSGVGHNKNTASATSSIPPQRHSLFHRPSTYSLEVSAGFDKLTLRLSKMAELLLSIFKEVPHVQLLSLRLLSETTKDMVGAIGSFLSSIADPSIYGNPEVLDPYLEMLEENWFHLSLDYVGSDVWWKKLSNYSHLLMECDHQVVCQVMYHLQCLFSHESGTLKSELTSRVIVPYHQHLMELVKTKCFIVTTSETEIGKNDSSSSSPSKKSRPLRGTPAIQLCHEGALEHNERVILFLFLKLLIKVISHPRCLATFASSGTNLYSLFLLFPLNSFRSAGLKVLEACFSTIHRFRTSTPNSAPSSPSSSSTPSSPMDSTQHSLHASQLNFQRPDKTGIQKTLLQILLSVAYSVQISKIPSYCISIAEGRATLQKYGLAEADEVHDLLVSTFEHSTIKQLLTEKFVQHISIMADVWNLLARMTTRDDSAADILRQNHIWDVVQVFGPCLANVLSRLHQRLAWDDKELVGMEGKVHALQECGVSLLADLQMLVHYLCWQRRDQRVSE